MQILEPQFAHIRSLLAYISHYEKFARYRRFLRPPQRHEHLAGDAAPALLHAWLLRKKRRRGAAASTSEEVSPAVSSATATAVAAVDPDPYASLPNGVRSAIRRRATAWWQWAIACVRFDIRRKTGPAKSSLRDVTRQAALQDR